MPDYEHVYKELQRDAVTLDLLWREYVEECHQNGELPYQSTQFNKYYNDFFAKKNATMHLNHKPGEIIQFDRAGYTARILDTDTGEAIKVYVFVATLPYSGYSYVEYFFSTDQECWTSAYVNTISTFIIAALRDQQFLSMADLNEAIWSRLYAFNHKPFQKKDGSRASLFTEEKPFLLALPTEP